MKKKIKIALLFGGRSAEHEISIRSARNIYRALDKNKYDVRLVGISQEGRWFLPERAAILLNTAGDDLTKLKPNKTELAVTPGEAGELVEVSRHERPFAVDVVFPILHGPFGEDGTVQGMLKLMDVPFVGSGVLGSALGMDKDVMKRLLNQAGIPTARFLVIRKHEKLSYKEAKRELGLPFFIKPANLGSSVGITKVHNKGEYLNAFRRAFQYDSKILIEEYIKGREIECSVLGNEYPRASLPGEIIPQHEFYSYEAKYLDANGAHFRIPIKLPKSLIKKIQETATKTFRTLELEGMARVDFFLTPRNKIVVNEVNTIPGFTAISMYPKLWEVSGLPLTKLIEELIRLAIERYHKERALKTRVD